MKYNWHFSIDRLISLRTLHGLSQEQFASKIGTKKQAVSQWERGEITPQTKTIEKIVNVFELSVGPAYFFVDNND